MMNRKYLNSVLIVFLIVIWGAVFYKYFGRKKPTKENLHSNNYTLTKINEFGIIKDTFKLELIEKDPFRANRKIYNNISKAPVKKSVKKVIIDKNIKWPKISYYGFIKSHNNNTRLVLLKIDNSVYRKREKELINNIRLVKAYNDSLIVSLNKKTKTIIRQ